MQKYLHLIYIFLISVTAVIAEPQQHTPQILNTTFLLGYHTYPDKVKEMIVHASKLTQQNLHYQYGSADPKNGGMDCSGTIYYLLRSVKQMEVPRQSDQIYSWTLKSGSFHHVTSTDFTNAEFADLKPGDLLFWSGTYEVKRTIPITHVMLYLGKSLQGKHLMFGASNGRTYDNKKIWGVSVFDFKLTSTKPNSRFVGYSCIPKINC
jgi:cell wall-associated NlpC family hydrolase